MKRLVVSIMAAALVLGIAPMTNAQVDSELAAQILGQFRLTSCRGASNADHFVGGMYNGSYASEWEARLPDLWITKLVVNGERVIDPDRGDKPQPALPYPAKGVLQNAWYWMECLEGSIQRLWGSANYSALEPREPIRLAMNFNQIEQKVEMELPPGVNPDDVHLKLCDEDGSCTFWKYDPYARQFRGWVDPLKRYSWVAYDVRTGTPLKKGVIDPKTGNPPDMANTMGLALPGGVVQVPFGYYTHLGTQLNGWALRCTGGFCGYMPAQTFNAEFAGESFYIYANGISDGIITVYAWAPPGEEMRIVKQGPVTDVLYIPAGYGQVVVTVTGKVTEKTYTTTFSPSGGKG